jgi:tetrahydromethanopterin S-methyltransferase subunit A
MQNTSADIPPGMAVVIETISQGMALDKCHKCGCMQMALDAARQAFASDETVEARESLKKIAEFQQQMEPIVYDCIGCKVCWGGEVTRRIEDCFGELDLGNTPGARESMEPTCSCSGGVCRPAWPPHPGEFIVGNPEGNVAICTLASHELPTAVISGCAAVAVAGKCDTENIGVEKVVLNILANRNIRWLILCGQESEGHCSGDAFLKLKEHGTDADMRVQQATSRRPVLKNLTMLDVASFRQQVEIINLVGCVVTDAVVAAVRQCAWRPVAPLVGGSSAYRSSSHETVEARPPKRLELDPSGFFVVLLNRPGGLIVCEHYENSGTHSHTIEGKEAALVAATAVELGLVSRLDHAAYLGRELANAESALRTGADYVQDAALGELPQDQVCSGSNCSCH